MLTFCCLSACFIFASYFFNALRSLKDAIQVLIDSDNDDNDDNNNMV